MGGPSSNSIRCANQNNERKTQVEEYVLGHYVNVFKRNRLEIKVFLELSHPLLKIVVDLNYIIKVLKL
jgi:hypothetical protein